MGNEASSQITIRDCEQKAHRKAEQSKTEQVRLTDIDYLTLCWRPENSHIWEKEQ